ncbi:uncharacterized protein LOC115971706 [Quercus lobata]|uniref:BSD domain-containing protein n=1 Tax=Quercus lobata TaxID=97700 RepID=A0A7N2RF10_QUELO|nr:uncharacterized protein LOC115971706 [Quercus lobata]
MSWLARSLANSLRIDDDDDDTDANDEDEENDVVSEYPNDSDPAPSSTTKLSHQDNNDGVLESEEAQSRGVKEDLSELKQTLTRQLWGVASFLAPPPPSSSSQSQPSSPSAHSDLRRLRFDDSAEISTKVNADSFGSEMESESDLEERGFGGVGITDEVLAFARNIGMHPETWLDFPIDEEEDLDDFDMSKAQQEHVLAIQYLAPRLAALRIELCPCHMSESYFWKVYFVLLHSRLNKHDSDILSTPQVVAARSMWMQELQKQTKEEAGWFSRSTFYSKDRANTLEEDFDPIPGRTFASKHTSSSMATDFETEKYPVESTELQFIDKSVIAEKTVIKTGNKDSLVGPSSKPLVQNFEDDEDEWPEEGSDFGGYSGTAYCMGNEDDISFSDLEDVDDGHVPIKNKIVVSKGFKKSP